MSDLDRDYKEALEKESRNLTAAVAAHELTLPTFRDELIQQVCDLLKRGKSVLIAGAPGVGKTCVIYGLAAQYPHPIFEFSTSSVLTETLYLGQWQTKLTNIVERAQALQAPLFIPDVWNLPNVGASLNDKSAMIDVLYPTVMSGNLQLLGEVSNKQLELVQKNEQLAGMFEVVHVEPLSSSQIETIVSDHAALQQLPMDPSGIARVMKICDQFLPDCDGPGNALRLVDQVHNYYMEKIAIDEEEAPGPEFVEKVFSIYSGLPDFVVSQSATKPISEIRRWFKDHIIGQDQAIEAVIETITLYKAGLHDPQKPIGSFLFVGPTGVGKTETAKALAKFLFGSETRLLRFDLSEYKDYYAFQMLVGNPDNPNSQAKLLDPVRSNPFQIVLLDEIEKAHPNIWDLLLQLLDEGQITPAHGKTVNFRNTIVIATSNVGAQEAQKNPIGFTGDDANAGVSMKALEVVFRPELLNRFQHIVPFKPLSKEIVKQIAEREIRKVLSREGVVSRNLAIEVGDEAVTAIIDGGYNQEYGARALKRLIQQQIILPIANYLMENEVLSGSLLKVIWSQGRARIRVLETAESRAEKHVIQEQRQARAKGYSADDIRENLACIESAIVDLAEAIDEDQVRQALADLDEQRHGKHFWQDLEHANAVLNRSERLEQQVRRLDRLRDQWEFFNELLDHTGKERLLALAKDVSTLESRVVQAQRELVGFQQLGENSNYGAAAVMIEIKPIANDAALRDLLFNTYRSWAQNQKFSVSLLHDPRTDDAPVLLSIDGPFAYGYLYHEAGIHRSRHDEVTQTVRVSIAPIRDEHCDVVFNEQRALKQSGNYGDKIRSRLEVVSPCQFILQNSASIAENQEQAKTIAASWCDKIERDDVVRRYDIEPFLVKDYMSDISSGKESILKPVGFHELLCQRADIAFN